MIRQGQPPPAGAAWRSYTFRPPDPVWVARSELRALQSALAKIEPDLDVWWSPARGRGGDPRRGRWRIVSWSPGSSNWLTVFYVEGPLGEYRPLSPMGPILRQVEKVAWTGRQSIAELEREVDEHNAKVKAARDSELEGAMREYLEDFGARHQGIRQTFAPGYIRRRSVAAKDLIETNHQRFLREHLGLRVAPPGVGADPREVKRRRGYRP